MLSVIRLHKDARKHNENPVGNKHAFDCEQYVVLCDGHSAFSLLFLK